jgi:hypothetical protein
LEFWVECTLYGAWVWVWRFKKAFGMVGVFHYTEFWLFF